MRAPRITSRRLLLVPILFAWLQSGCRQLPLIQFQDQRFEKNAPIYLSRDPRKKPDEPTAPSETEMRGKR